MQTNGGSARGPLRAGAIGVLCLLTLPASGDLRGLQSGPVEAHACHVDGFARAPLAPDPSLPVDRAGIRLTRPDDSETRAELDLWCRAVGPPVARGPGPAEPELATRGAASAGSTSDSAGSTSASAGSTPASAGSTSSSATPGRSPSGPTESGPGADAIALVAWNTHVGGGDLDRLLEDLLAGRLTSAPVGDFVLLLQEVYRAGEAVPDHVAGPVRTADRIAGEGGGREAGAIDAFAARHGLHLFYAPSMRNGHLPQERSGTPGAPAEDRGNAILSTLPLSDLEMVELPVRKQRRVAAAATVHVTGPRGEPLPLRLVSVHLDHVSSWRRLHRSLGADRALDAEHLVATFAEEARIVVGGDFNTWFRGGRERAVRLMREHFPGPADPPAEATLDAPGFPFDRLVDHLFFRLDGGWTGDYRVAPDRYGSDHRPLVGWIRPAHRPQTAQADPATPLAEWIRSLEIDPRVTGELARYRAGGEPLDDSARSSFAAASRSVVHASAADAVRRLLEGPCTPAIDVHFGEDALATPIAAPAEGPDASRAFSRFAEAVVRVEVVACFDGAAPDPGRALALFVDPAFRLATESRIRTIEENGAESCVATGGVTGLLAPSRACNRIDQFHEGPFAAEHSQVVSNADAEGLQTIYFKESLKTFVAVPGGVALHYVNVSRSADVGRMGRWLAGRSVREGEERKVEALRERLTEPPAPNRAPEGVRGG